MMKPRKEARCRIIMTFGCFSSRRGYVSKKDFVAHAKSNEAKGQNLDDEGVCIGACDASEQGMLLGARWSALERNDLNEYHNYEADGGYASNQCFLAFVGKTTTNIESLTRRS